MKLHTFLLAAALAVSGCDKPNDMPRLQDEITTATTNFRHRYTELAERLAAIGKRGDALGPAASAGEAARRDFQEAREIVEGQLRQLDPKVVAERSNNAAKTGPEEVQKLFDGMNRTFEDGLLEANAKADAADAWLHFAAQHLVPTAVAAAPPEPAPTEPTPAEPVIEGSNAPPDKAPAPTPDKAPAPAAKGTTPTPDKAPAPKGTTPTPTPAPTRGSATPRAPKADRAPAPAPAPKQ